MGTATGTQTPRSGWIWSDPSGTALVRPDGALVSSVGSAYADLKTTNTAAANTAALQAAHDSLTGRGGWVIMPAGEFDLYGTVTISAGDSAALGAQSVTFSGQGMGATVLTQTQVGVPTFQKTTGHAHGFQDFSLYGPGTSNADSVGIDWTAVSGGSLWRNLWIEGFGVGARFVDATSMTFMNVHYYGNGVNEEIGYNCDIFNYIGGRSQNAVTVAMHFGYLSAGHPAQPMVINPCKVIGRRFGAGPLAIKIDDYGASNIQFDSCYFENYEQIATIGNASTTVGPKQIKFENCFFTQVGAGGSLVQIDIAQHANQETSLTLSHCRSDTATFAGQWVKSAYNSRLAWIDCLLLTTGSHIGHAGSANYTVNAYQDFYIGRAQMANYDGSQLGSVLPIDKRFTQATGEILEQWRRLSTAGVEFGTIAKVQDYGGTFVAMNSPLRPATPVAALPTAASTYRGITVYQEGAGGVADTIVCCMKDSAGNYSWKVVATG